MPQMIVNIPPYEGEYEFDLEGRPFNTDEWEWVFKISGYLPLTLEQGFAGGDPRLFVAWAVVAMNRSGKISDDEVLDVAAVIRKAPFDGTAISYRGEDEEAEELDPQSGSASLDSTPSSGDGSSGSTEPSPENVTPLSSGIQGLATGSASGRETLAG